MKNKRLLLIPIGTLALAAILFALGCSPQAPNTNNANAGRAENTAAQNAQNAQNASSEPASLAGDACDDTNDKRKAVRGEIEKGIKGKGYLHEQLRRKVFKFELYPGPSAGTFHLYFSGKLANPDALGDLAAILKKVLKKTCVEKVYFATDGVLPLDTTKAVTMTDGEFFEWWWGCPDPQVPCVGGECKRPEECPMSPEPQPTGGTGNSNTGNSNSKP